MRHRVTQIISTLLILCPYAPYAAVNTQSYLKDLKNAHEDIKTVKKCTKDKNCDDDCKASFDNITAIPDKLVDLEKDFKKLKAEIVISVDGIEEVAQRFGRTCQKGGRRATSNCDHLPDGDQSTCEKHFMTDGPSVYDGDLSGIYKKYYTCKFTDGKCKQDQYCGKGANRKNFHEFFDDLKKAIKEMSIHKKDVLTKRIEKRIEALKDLDQTLRKKVQDMVGLSEDAVVLSDIYKEFHELTRDNKTLIKRYKKMCQSQWSN
tara:strand:+ start:387 stop:1169 length:783 start_codon:yes stop_codon:yes gene_type:complete